MIRITTKNTILKANFIKVTIKVTLPPTDVAEASIWADLKAGIEVNNSG